MYLAEYGKCVLFFALLFVVLSVASFHPTDATTFHVASHRTADEASFGNLFGPLGAQVSDWAWQLFGLGALVFSFVFIAQLLSSFQRPRRHSRVWLRLAGYPQLVFCYLALLALVRPEWRLSGVTFSTGGLVGSAVAGAFESMLGRGGALVALAFGTAASLPLCLGVRPVGLVLKVLGAVPFARVRGWLETIEEPASSAAASALAPGGSFEGPTQVEVNAHEQHKPSEGFLAGKAPMLRPSAMPGEASAPGANALPVGMSSHAIGKIDGYKANLPALSNDAAGNKAVQAADFSSLVGLLEAHKSNNSRDPADESHRLGAQALQLEEKLGQFGVTGKVLRSQPGPVVNVHEFEPAAGVKVTKVIGLQDDLTLGLKAQSILMAPQPGKSTIGIEIPSAHRETVSLRDIMESPMFQGNGAPLPMAIGKLVDGSPLVADLASMPHLLIAGATGSGKSVGINVTLLSLMMSRTPKQLRLILVDPKMLELSNYDGIGHLLMPVVTEPHKAAGALRWALDEMERRYRLMKNAAVRNIAGFNAEVENGRGGIDTDSGQPLQELPYIVVVIDELCDLMMTAPKDVEDSVQRLAQKARAAGIHLVLATQRPSVDVLTGVIKANLPCRISFQVASKHDSRTIIESIGAEKLLGRGDMLFLPPGTSKLVRAHGAYVGDKEINRIADRLRELYPVRYDAAIIDEVERAAGQLNTKDKDLTRGDSFGVDGNTLDENTLYDRAVEFAVMTGVVSTSSIQRHFRIGYNRAARLMDRMDAQGLVGPSDVAGKPRAVLAAARERMET